MKSLYILFSLALFSPSLMAKDPAPAQPSPKEQVAQSLKAWEKAKVECGGNYTYIISFSSWVGFGHSSEIVVRDNKVVERRYRERSGRPQAPVAPGQPAKEPEGEKWTERGAALGSHKKGAPCKTLDELYAEAAKVAEKQLSPMEKMYVRVDDQGLLKSCFYINTMIADDAPKTGVSISKLTLEPKPAKAEK